MKRLLSILALLCAFGLTTASLVQSAPTMKESTSIVQGTLMEIKGSFYSSSISQAKSDAFISIRAPSSSEKFN